MTTITLGQTDAEAWIHAHLGLGTSFRFEYMNTLPAAIEAIEEQERVYLNTADMRPRRFATNVCDRLFALRFDIRVVVSDVTIWMPYMVIRDDKTYTQNTPDDHWQDTVSYECTLFVTTP